MDKLFTIFTIKLLSWIVYPTVGFTSYLSYLQFTDKQIFGGIVWGIATVIAIIIASYVKLKLGNKQLDVTDTQNETNASITLAKMFQQMATEEKEFWTKRLDDVALRLRGECEEEKKYWTEREEKIRNEKHDQAQKFQSIIIKYEGTLMQLKARGIETSSDGQLIWPDKLKASRIDDTKVISGELTLNKDENGE